MAFYNLNDLTQRVIRRLRLVPGANSQLYSNDVIADLIIEAYEVSRAAAWWDHLTTWYTRELDGVTGLVTVPFVGASAGWADVQGVYLYNNTQPMTIIDQFNNPYRFTGTTPRGVLPLTASEDPNNQHLFRVWPMTSVTPVGQPIRVRLRCDPPGLFTSPVVPVPFDSIALINYATFKFLADDSSNPTAVASLEAGYAQRMTQLKTQHNSATIIMDPRMDNPQGPTEWMEYP